MTINLSTIRKALVAATTVAAELIALGVLHGTALTTTQIALSVAGAIGVYAVPNARGPSVNHPAAQALDKAP
jgi:hypothetical protein